MSYGVTHSHDAFVAQLEHVQPQGDMPTLPFIPAESRDIAAYLYTLR